MLFSRSTTAICQGAPEALVPTPDLAHDGASSMFLVQQPVQHALVVSQLPKHAVAARLDDRLQGADCRPNSRGSSHGRHEGLREWGTGGEREGERVREDQIPTNSNALAATHEA